MDPWVEPASADESVGAWADSGLMALTGRADGPGLGPPAGFVARTRELALDIADRTEDLGSRLDLDGLEVLAQRAASLGLSRQGATSCGGATRLLATIDGWVAVALLRPDDVDLVPAWLELDRAPAADRLWEVVAEAVLERPARTLADRGRLLGLPVAVLGALGPNEMRRPAGPPVVGARQVSASPAPGRGLAGLRVVDLSSLWAGPLCGRLLARGGADVIKVESTARPDGSRSGPAPFFDLMNEGKRSLAVDFGDPADVERLGRLVSSADVVIEASRPRALEQLGIHAEAVVERGAPVWISITAYGRDVRQRDRVGFGDDTAVAGGLVAWDAHGPVFCADAAADPLAGLTATSECLKALAAGGRWIIDVPLARVAAAFAGPTVDVPETMMAAPPRPPGPSAPGPSLGQHTTEVWRELGAAR